MLLCPLMRWYAPSFGGEIQPFALDAAKLAEMGPIFLLEPRVHAPAHAHARQRMTRAYVLHTPKREAKGRSAYS